MRLTVFGIGIFLLFFFSTSIDGSSSLSRNESRVIRQNLEQILSQPQFQYTDQLGWFEKPFQWLKTNWDKLWNKVADWLQKLFHYFASHKQVNGRDFWLMTALNWLGVGLVALMPIWLICNWNRLFVHNQRHRQQNRSQPSVIFTPEYYLKCATQQADADQYREALRYIYLANLERLKNNGYLIEGYCQSDQDNLKRLQAVWGSAHPIVNDFRQLILLFREKWYGFQNCRPEDYQLACDLFARIWLQIGGQHGL